LLIKYNKEATGNVNYEGQSGEMFISGSQYEKYAMSRR